MKKMMEDPDLTRFGLKRTRYGGFKVLVDL